MALSLDERRIAEIVQQVVAELRPSAGSAQADGRATNLAKPPSLPNSHPQNAGEHGVFVEIDDAIMAAQVAQRRLADIPLQRRAALIAFMRKAAKENAQVLARAAWQETGMGRHEDKTEKNLLVAERTPGTEA